VSLVAVLAAGPLAAGLTDSAHASTLETLIRTMALGVPFMVLTRVLTAVSRSVDEPGPGVLYDLGGQPVLRLFTAVIAVAAGAHAAGLGWSVTGPAILCFCLSAWHARRSLIRAGIGLSWPRGRDLHGYGEFVRFGLPRGLEEVVQASSTWLLTVMVGAMAGPAEAATYATLTRLTMGTGLLLQAVTTSMLPRLSASFARQAHDELNEMFQTTTRWLIVISLPMCFGLLLFPGALLAIASPDLPGGRVGLQLLAIGALVNVLTGPVGGIVLMAGRSSVNLVVALVSVAVMLGLALALIPPHGASGAGGAWAVAIVIQNALLYGYARWRLRLSAWTRELYRPLIMVTVFSCLPTLVTRIVAGDEVGAVVVAGVLSVAGLGVVLARHEVTQPG
jgi:O-antigen/teichoic acid export membrane protein